MAKKHNKPPERIIQDPDILVGKPVIKGTRIAVELVLAKLAANPDLAELFQDYPRLTVDDVKACLTYAQELVAKQQKATRQTNPPA
jgi:uncharacterized protein (DUF433 family)